MTTPYRSAIRLAVNLAPSSARSLVGCSLLLVADQVGDEASSPIQTLSVHLVMPSVLKSTCHEGCPVHWQNRSTALTRRQQINFANLTASVWGPWFGSLDSAVVVNATTPAQRTLLREFGEIYRKVCFGDLPICPGQFTRVLLNAACDDIRTNPFLRVIENTARGVQAVVSWVTLLYPEFLESSSDGSDDELEVDESHGTDLTTDLTDSAADNVERVDERVD